MHEFSVPKLLAALTDLTVEAQSAFAQACAIRTLTSCSVRCPLVDSAQSLCLRALAAAEASMASCVRADEFRRLNEQFDALRELDDDRVAACAFVVRHLHSGGNPHEAVWAAQRAYESQDQLAKESMVFQSYTVDVEAKLLTFPAVQAELQSQRNDIEDLTARPSNWMAIVLRAKTNRT